MQCAFNYEILVAQRRNGCQNQFGAISATNSPIIMIYSVYIIFPRTISTNLIFCLILDCNMTAKIQNGGQEIIDLYKLRIISNIHFNDTIQNLYTVTMATLEFSQHFGL